MCFGDIQNSNSVRVARWAFFRPKFILWAFFGVLLFSEKKPTKFGFFGRFFGVDRKLFKFHLHNTNFNLFFIHF